MCNWRSFFKVTFEIAPKPWDVHTSSKIYASLHAVKYKILLREKLKRRYTNADSIL